MNDLQQRHYSEIATAQEQHNSAMEAATAGYLAAIDAAQVAYFEALNASREALAKGIEERVAFWRGEEPAAGAQREAPQVCSPVNFTEPPRQIEPPR